MSAVSTLKFYVRPDLALSSSGDKATFEVFKVSSVEQGANKVHNIAVSIVEIPVSSLFINGQPKVFQSSIGLPNGVDDCQFFFKFKGSCAALAISKKEIGNGAVGLTLRQDNEKGLLFDSQILKSQERYKFSQIEPKVNESRCTIS